MTVFRGYDQKALDAQYDNMARVPEAPAHVKRWIEESRAAYARPGWRRDVAYGEDQGETLDVFPGKGPKAPAMMFFHGGYWRARDKSEFAYLLEGLREAGAALVLANYGLCPRIAMSELVRQCRRAVGFLYRHAGDFGIDRERLFVSGHSAGGHIVGELLSTDWVGFEAGLPRDPIKGAVALSGLYDLAPIRLCFLNADLRMDAAEAEALSPVRHVPSRAPRLVIAVGGKESEEYHRQQSDYVAAWRAKRLSVVEVPMPGHDHFTIVSALADPKGPLGRDQLDLMGLA